jgi:hypothetical protein
MTRFVNIPEYEDFFKNLKLALHNFSVEHNVTTNQHFADVLCIKGLNKHQMFASLLNPSTGKDLKVRELILLLDNLTSDTQKDVLDFLAKRYGFIVSESVVAANTTDSLKDILLNINSINGDVSKEYLLSIRDNEISKSELDTISKLLYQARAVIREFELKLEGLSK